MNREDLKKRMRGGITHSSYSVRFGQYCLCGSLQGD